jgi:hypothetical protein
MRQKEFVWDHLNLNDINWDQMINNSRTKEKDLKNPTIENGKSLIQVCIENENTERGTWQLKDLMKSLLKIEELEVNIFDDKQEFNLLSFCYKEKRHQAFDFLIEQAAGRININEENKDGSTTFGLLFYSKSLPWFTEHGFKPSEKLELLLQKFDKINKNKPQIKLD